MSIRSEPDLSLVTILLFAISLNTCQSCNCSSDPQLERINRNVSRGSDELVEIRKRFDTVEATLKAKP